MNTAARIETSTGEVFDVRRFVVQERISELFEITLIVVSENHEIDLERIAGCEASFTLEATTKATRDRTWSGICHDFRQVAAEERGLSTYQFGLVPELWLASQRRNFRMFQHMSELEIALQLLSEWTIEPSIMLGGEYKKRKYRVQYGETDFAFLSRMLEDAGISFYFATLEGGSRFVLSDAPHQNAARAAIPYRSEISLQERESDHLTRLQIGRRLRPGGYAVRDHDYRLNPGYKLLASAQVDGGVERRLEVFDYIPGAFLFGTDKGDDTPAADDRGKSRTDEAEGAALTRKRLEAERSDASHVAFDTNALDLAPGVVLGIKDHPRADLRPENTLLVLEATIEGELGKELRHHCVARSTATPFRPTRKTPKPRAVGVESATVVGPAGEEIHTDEFGRVRVHFHWDRESAMDNRSSCWIHVSQPWGGSAYGALNLPRVGQEVLVDFLGGDPDQPVIVGRLFTNLQKVPYKLPELKTQSGWKSNSTHQTGGYNEIMFEDAAGREAVRIQAERDLNKIVKNDESASIGRDRAKKVGRDDSHSVGRDRTHLVGNNDAVSVSNHQSVVVGGNRDAAVGGNQSDTVAVNQSVQVGANQSTSVGADMTLSVGGGLAISVGGSKSETVGAGSTEIVGAAKALLVGANYAAAVTADMTTTVGGNVSESVAGAKIVQVGTAYDIVCGGSKVHIDAGGVVVIEASNIALKASGPIAIEAGATVKVQASGCVTILGSTVSVN